MSEQEHKKGGIELSERELAQTIVIVILGVFFVFLAGYFLGKRRMCEELAQGDEVRFEDKIHRALTNLANRAGEPADEEEDQDSTLKNEETASVTSSEQDLTSKAEPSAVKAYAQLSGYASEAAAKAYAGKLLKRGIKTSVIDKTSKSGRGRRVTWYQVVTETMNKSDLVELVEGIKKRDKLSNVSIVDISE